MELKEAQTKQIKQNKNNTNELIKEQPQIQLIKLILKKKKIVLK